MNDILNDIFVSAPLQYRAIWISDIHLGTRGCKADYLLDFLRHTDALTIYLVGDIVDGWRLRKSWYWPQSHNDVVQKLLRKVRHGTRVVYVPGNHDEWLRDYATLRFGGVEILKEAVHVTADGRRLLVIHGDWFDLVVTHARWLALLGDGAYTLSLWVNHHFNKVLSQAATGCRSYPTNRPRPICAGASGSRRGWYRGRMGASPHAGHARELAGSLAREPCEPELDHGFSPTY